MNHKNCAANIFVGVGGYKNIASICRCASRIRIDLWDDSKSARKPRADEVVLGQCGLRSINLKRAAMPHVSF